MWLTFVCLTILDIKTAQCDVACKNYGYDGGMHHEDKCLCVEEKAYTQLIKKPLSLPKKIKPVNKPSESFSFDF